MENTGINLKFNSTAYMNEEIQNYRFDAKQETVLAFFPGAFTSVCTDEMCTIQDKLSSLEDLEAKIVGISVDTPFALKEFARQNELDFILVSDTSREIISQYDVETEIPELGYKVAKRAVFVVREGEIIYKEVLDDPSNLPDIQRLKETLARVGNV
jgi:peroxiredoxin